MSPIRLSSFWMRVSSIRFGCGISCSLSHSTACSESALRPKSWGSHTLLKGMEEKCCHFVPPVHYARERVRCIRQLNRKAASIGGNVAHKVRKVAVTSTRRGTFSIALWRWPGGSSAPKVVPVRPRVFLKTIAPGCRTRTRNGIRLKDFSHVYKHQNPPFSLSEFLLDLTRCGMPKLAGMSKRGIAHL